MPEHVHLVLLPPEGMRLGLVIREIKSRSAKRYFAVTDVAPQGQKHVSGQRRCYDHNCRSIESVREKVRYCHNNPVARGLVNAPGDWEWSSYNWYRGRRDVPLTVDDFVFGVVVGARQLSHSRAVGYQCLSSKSCSPDGCRCIPLKLASAFRR